MRMLLLALQLPLLFFALFAAADDRPVITLAADDWCPYNCDQGADRQGYVVELVRELFDQSEYRVVYQNMPWARALQLLEAGQITAAIGVTHDELPTAVFPDEPIGYFQGHFLLPSHSDWHYSGPESLGNMRLGVINGYDYGEFNQVIDQLRGSDRLMELSGDDAINRGLGMLARGRIDAFLEDRDVARYTVSQLGLRDKVRSGDSVGQPVVLYLAFSQQHPTAEKHAQQWSTGIRLLRASGRLAEILSTYGVEDWQ
ncbi:MAG: ABC transporter substrate-binding protein [Halopseudomonas sp.]